MTLLSHWLWRCKPTSVPSLFPSCSLIPPLLPPIMLILLQSFPVAICPLLLMGGKLGHKLPSEHQAFSAATSATCWLDQRFGSVSCPASGVGQRPSAWVSQHRPSLYLKNSCSDRVLVVPSCPDQHPRMPLSWWWNHSWTRDYIHRAVPAQFQHVVSRSIKENIFQLSHICSAEVNANCMSHIQTHEAAAEWDCFLLQMH